MTTRPPWRSHGYRDLRHQPVWSLNLIYQLTSTLLVRIPFWAASYVSKSRRPWKTWSLRRSVAARALAHIVEHVESRSVRAIFQTCFIYFCDECIEQAL